MISRLIAAVLLSAAASSAGVSPFPGLQTEALLAASAPVDDSTTTSPDTTALDNPFLPEDANIGDCVSALPRPECGSEARGGWRQALVFVALVVAIGLIGLRLALGLRKRART